MPNNHTLPDHRPRLGVRVAEFVIGAPPSPARRRAPRPAPRTDTRPDPRGASAERPAASGRADAPTATGHIHGLDGVRAGAVALVVVFHLWPSLLPGGFLGVDVFFVVSGFLITTLLLREHQRRERVDLESFWRRRARRLLPALAFMVFTSIVVAMAVNRDLLVDVARQTLGAATFSTNWVEIAAGTDYFADGDRALFNPLWSLAVEEQFYLLWPLAFTALAASTLTPRRTARLLRAVALLSAGWMAVQYDPGSTTRVYYGTDTHLFGLMIGASVAYAFWDPGSRLARASWHRLRRWIGGAATVVLIALCLGLDDGSAITYRGGILAASLCTAVVVASLPGPATGWVRLLETKPLRWVGQRSYAIYLWHWPVLLIVVELMPRTAPGTTTGIGTATIVVAATLALSEISMRWVETPVRTHGFRVALRPVRAMAAGRGGRTVAGGVATAVAVMATTAAIGAAAVGIATAPDRSAAQESVETGLRMIEQANAQGRAVVLGAADTAGATSAPPPTPAPTGSPPAPTSPPEPTPVPTPTGSAPTIGPAWPPELAVPPGELITGLGDSVLSGAAPAMYERFPGIHLEATPILQWHDAPAIVNELAEADELRPVVVLNFGTNAGLVDEESQDALREVLDVLGPGRRVVLVTIVGVSHWVDDSNQALRAISADHPNTAVADWHAVVAGDPDLLHTDRTHPNMAGISVYADLIARTAEELGPG